MLNDYDIDSDYNIDSKVQNLTIIPRHFSDFRNDRWKNPEIDPG